MFIKSTWMESRARTKQEPVSPIGWVRVIDFDLFWKNLLYKNSSREISRNLVPRVECCTTGKLYLEDEDTLPLLSNCSEVNFK